MALAIGLGARGLGRVWPNPAVGCVIVHDGRIVGRGWTQPGGRPHAETMALAQAGTAARGAVAYVSLEPCAHHGQTPPCADALIASGVARVVSALEDPDPRVAGQGHRRLAEAGINVETGVLATEAGQAQAGFLSRIRRGRPMLTLKLATSLDGRIATASGESRWITGPEARSRVHVMRASHDAVLIGSGTARADDPVLTVRGLGVSHQPMRIIAASSLNLPLEGALAASAAQVPWLLAHAPDAPQDRRLAWGSKGARLLEIPGSGAGLDVTALLQALGGLGLTRIFCEGGGQLAAALLRAELVDELAVFGAGIVLGGDGLPSIGSLDLARLADAPGFRLGRLHRIGADHLGLWTKA
jgi:diaminohydroxyphosphoribosylaminopyrimidine deaminase / 5-amino-6-(5-phosphoribosylamino)uracil reductase